MKTFIVLGLICLFLLVACVPPIDMVTEEGAICKRISQNPRVCEIRLTDGTQCVIAFSGSVTGGIHIACDWQ